MEPSTFNPHPAPDFNDPADFARFREALRAADFSTAGVVNAINLKTLDDIRHIGRPVLIERTAAGRPIDTLIRLFLVRVPISRDEAAKALAPLPLDRLLASNLVTETADGIEIAFGVIPYDGFVLFFDSPASAGKPPYSDYVMGVGGSTMTLVQQIIRKPSRLTLDMGCGCGTLGFVASRFSQRVIGIDRNPRALAMARFNIRVNDVRNYEVMESDFFNAVQDMKFDLILSNPPFVITPRKTYIYRDGGMQGDGVTEFVSRHAALQLAKGGYAQILCNWAHMKGKAWESRLASWVEGSGCDMFVMRTKYKSPIDYAMMWIEETEKGLATEARWTLLQDWLNAYRELGIEGVGAGLITIRRSDAPSPWFDWDSGPDKGVGLTGAHLEQMIMARDFLRATPGSEALFHARLRCSPQLRIAQHVRLTPEGWRLIEADARVEPGYPFGGELDPTVMNLLFKLDGSCTLADAVSALARESGADPETTARRAAPIIEHMMKRGMLAPA